MKSIEKHTHNYKFTDHDHHHHNKTLFIVLYFLGLALYIVHFFIKKNINIEIFNLTINTNLINNIILVIAMVISGFHVITEGFFDTLKQTIAKKKFSPNVHILMTLAAIGAYVDRRPESLSFNKTKNRTLVARLNKAVEMADHILGTDGYHEDSIEQRHASLFCNQLMVCEDNYKVCYYPEEKFREYLDLLLEK